MAAAAQSGRDEARVSVARDIDIIIAGAGIGGLTAALELQRAGFRPRVYESVEEIRPIGVGINILPHAAKVFGECGLLDALRATAIETKDLSFFNKFGQKIWSEPRGIEAGYIWPQLSIDRGDLQMILLDAVRDRLGADAVITGHHLSDFEPNRDGRTNVRFVDRRTGAPIAERAADLLVGADGIHSTVRAKFCPDEGSPTWNGVVVWRAASESPPFLSGHSMVVIGNAIRRFIAYPVSRAHAARGSSLINWVAELKTDPNKPYRREDWNRRGKLDDFFPQFEDWRFGWLNVPSIIRAATDIYELPRLDRDPIGGWTHGRATLLGDAAHPMYPMGSNGASQAIVDARALATSLLVQSDIDSALASYELERRPTTSAVVVANRQEGPAEILSIVDKRAPNGFDDIESVISAAELAAIAQRYKRMAGFDRATVNSLPAARSDRGRAGVICPEHSIRRGNAF